ncbi:unnamed protein product [Soboliphyme baturini]|uniref:DUF2388 domain-containing protein n=1 Tax=Soboliphyme baturini TaxID=241478 RepID=A0A183J7H3_9BILA|nr:unnamed protein product [Soboliphyme baturini]
MTQADAVLPSLRAPHGDGNSCSFHEQSTRVRACMCQQAPVERSTPTIDRPAGRATDHWSVPENQFSRILACVTAAVAAMIVSYKEGDVLSLARTDGTVETDVRHFAFGADARRAELEAHRVFGWRLFLLSPVDRPPVNG